MAGTLGSITISNHNLKVFTVGASNVTISSMMMGLYSNIPSSNNITWNLYAVDGSNNPTGSILATDTQSQAFATTGSASKAYYTFTTGGTLASYNLLAGQTYGLLFRSSALSATLSWTTLASPTVYTPGAGFTFVANRRSTNYGNSFSTSSYYNAWQMNVTPVSGAVPEPGEWAAMGILGAGLTGLVLRNRRR